MWRVFIDTADLMERESSLLGEDPLESWCFRQRELVCGLAGSVEKSTPSPIISEHSLLIEEPPREASVCVVESVWKSFVRRTLWIPASGSPANLLLSL